MKKVTIDTFIEDTLIFFTVMFLSENQNKKPEQIVANADRQELLEQ